MEGPLVEPKPSVLSSPERLEGLVRAWLEEVRSHTGSERTASEYRRILERFLNVIGWDAALRTPSTAEVHAFASGPGPRDNHRSKEKPSSSTVTVRLAALRSFYDFARRMGAPVTDPTVDVKRPRKKDPIPRGLSSDEVRQLLAAVPDTPSGKRDRAVIVTMALMGLRRSEALNIRAGDLSRNGGAYLTWRAKGGNERRRELPAPAFREIVAAVEAKGRFMAELSADERLFDVSGSGFAANLRRYAKRAELEGVSPHTLRHTAAKLRRGTGASLEDVSSFLGHGDLATTARYLKRLEGEDDDGWRAAAALLGVT